MCTKINKSDARAPPSSRNGAHCAASQLNHETTCIFNPLNPGVACFSACLGPVAFCRLFFFACVKGYNLFLGRPTRSNGWKFNLAIHGNGLGTRVCPVWWCFDGVPVHLLRKIREKWLNEWIGRVGFWNSFVVSSGYGLFIADRIFVACYVSRDGYIKSVSISWFLDKK